MNSNLKFNRLNFKIGLCEKAIYDYLNKTYGKITKKNVFYYLNEIKPQVIKGLSESKIKELINRTFSQIEKENPNIFLQDINNFYFHVKNEYKFIEISSREVQSYAKNFNYKKTNFIFLNSKKDLIIDAISSSTLEGNTINSTEEYNKRLNHDYEKMEIINYLNIEKKLISCQYPLSKSLLLNIHKQLFKNLENTKSFQSKLSSIGSFKKVRNYLSNGFLPCQPFHLDENINKFIVFFNEKPKNFSEAIVRAGIAHCIFERIHPFSDGNGRVGRLLIQYYFFIHNFSNKLNFSISTSILNKKKEYYGGLAKTIKNYDYWMNNFKIIIDDYYQYSLKNKK